MKIMLFLQGTLIMHRSGAGVSREGRVSQVVKDEQSVQDYASYVPVGNSVEKLREWKRQGAEILYLSSHRTIKDVDKDRGILERYGFPDGEVLFCKKGERYKDLAERVVPDVLIEDDCESIGGEMEMVFPHIRQEIKNRVKSIVVREFEGIDHLPDSVSALLNH